MQLNKINENNLQTLQQPKTIYRKTSAEIVSEAKSVLAASGGGALRLVQTRRPITPQVKQRHLYGKEQAPAGRPPSAFSLKYLQYETRALPCLEPIKSAVNRQLLANNLSTTSSQNEEKAETSKTKVKRSGSVDTLMPIETSTTNGDKTKLPALLNIPPKSIDDIKACMPNHKSSLANSLPTNLVDNSGLKRKQTQSFDDKVNNNNSNKPATLSVSIPASNIAVDKRNEAENKVMNKEMTSTKNRLIRSNDLLSQSSTETLLEMLKAHAGIKECSDETTVHINGILMELYTRVKGTRGNWKGAVLGALYGLVECNSPKILLSIARVVLALGVTGSNLTGACKLIFKVARNEVNDSLFIDSDVPELLVDGLGRASPTDEPEACIYGYGAIRFLATANANTLNKKSREMDGKTITVPKAKSLAYRLARHGIIQLMIIHLQILNESGSHSKLCGPPLHALYQLSGALRALSGAPVFAQIIASKSLLNSSESEKKKNPNNKDVQEPQDIHLELAGKHLVKAAEICMDEPEVQANIIRTLSILSDIEQCCEYLASDSARLGILFGPIGYNSAYGGGGNLPEKPLGAISRLGYILGNIMARNDAARLEFYNNDVAMEYLLNTLEFYSNQRYDIKNHNGDSVLDVLVKLIRVVANMSVNSEVGYGLGLRNPLGSTLLNVLLTGKEIKILDTEELLMATLGALHNLSYYQNTSLDDTNTTHHPGSIVERMKDISATLCQILHNGPPLTKSEAARVLGNMTRNPIARQSFCSSNGLKVLVKCLQSEDMELAATCCGVLVNLLGDWDRRAPFKELKGPQLLRDILQKSALEEDWLLAGMVCQALWNFLIDSSNVIDSLGEDEADLIAGDLAEYLDDERLFQGQPPDPAWEHFAIVATDLLERIQSCMSIANSPCISSADEDDIDVNPGDTWDGKYKEWLKD